MLITGQSDTNRHEYILALQLSCFLNLLEQSFNCSIVQVFYLRQLFQQHIDNGRYSFSLQNCFCFLVFKIEFIIEVHFYAFRNLGSIGNVLLCGYYNTFQPSQLFAFFFAGHVACSNHVRFSSFKECFRIQLTHIVLVNPVQLVDIENSGVLGNAVHAEFVNQLVHAEDFLLAVRSPAQKCQEVVNSFRQVTQLTILVNTGSAVTLAHFGVVLAQNQGNVTEGRLFEAQCIINEALTRSVGQMLFSADYMSNVHQRIIDNYSIVIGRNTVGFNNNEITDIIGIKNYIATNHVANENLLVGRNAEANGRFAAFSFKLSNLLFGQMTAFAHITRHFAFFDQALAFFLQLLIGAVAIVSLAFSQQLVSIFFVDIKTFHLMIRSVRAANINALIPVHTQPLQSSLDIFLGFRGRTLTVGILDTQNQLAAGFAGQQIVEQRTARTTDMERAGRARRKSYSNFIITH